MVRRIMHSVLALILGADSLRNLSGTPCLAFQRHLGGAGRFNLVPIVRWADRVARSPRQHCPEEGRESKPNKTIPDRRNIARDDRGGFGRTGLAAGRGRISRMTAISRASARRQERYRRHSQGLDGRTQKSLGSERLESGNGDVLRALRER